MSVNRGSITNRTYLMRMNRPLSFTKANRRAIPLASARVFPNHRFQLLLVFAVVLSATPAVSEDLDRAGEGEKLFALHVQPLLAERCWTCHGADPDDIGGGLDLRSRLGLLAGGDSFGNEVVRIGDGKHSMLYVVTTGEEEGYEMPPKEADRLTETQQSWIRDWIDAGAPWPNEQRVQQLQQGVRHWRASPGLACIVRVLAEPAI